MWLVLDGCEAPTVIFLPGPVTMTMTMTEKKGYQGTKSSSEMTITIEGGPSRHQFAGTDLKLLLYALQSKLLFVALQQ